MDIKHNYIEKGQGFPLLLLHGNGEECGYFEHQIEYFSEKYHVYAIDTRGHGQTERGDAPFTIRQFADDLKDFMDDHQLDKAHILGFSDGGNIAMIFTMKYPEHVERLILNGANLDGKGVRFIIQFPIILEYYWNKLLSRLPLGNLSKKAHTKAEFLGLMVHDPNVKTEELESITCPTLVIAGTEDMIRKDHTALIAANIPGAKLAYVEGDHFVANKNATEFNSVVEGFLEEEIDMDNRDKVQDVTENVMSIEKIECDPIDGECTRSDILESYDTDAELKEWKGRYRNIGVRMSDRVVRVENSQALKKFMGLRLGDAMLLADQLKKKYYREFDKKLEIGTVSLAVELMGHFFIQEVCLFMRRHIRWIPCKKAVNRFCDWLLVHMDIIDCGEKAIDNNRFVWDLFAIPVKISRRRTVKRYEDNRKEI